MSDLDSDFIRAAADDLARIADAIERATAGATEALATLQRLDEEERAATLRLLHESVRAALPPMRIVSEREMAQRERATQAMVADMRGEPGAAAP